MALATLADVADRVGRPLTTTEQARTSPGLLDEATALVLAHLGLDEEPSPIPAAVKIVTSRMVARVLTQGTNVPTGAESVTQTMGPFSEGYQFGSGSTSGAPWLTAADRLLLKRYTTTGSAFSIDTAPVVTLVHADICALNFGALYCSCGASLTLAGPLDEYGEG